MSKLSSPLEPDGSLTPELAAPGPLADGNYRPALSQPTDHRETRRVSGPVGHDGTAPVRGQRCEGSVHGGLDECGGQCSERDDR